MCRWFSFFILPYIVYLISAEEQYAKNSLLNRAVHPRRHKRAEKGPLMPLPTPSPFMSMTADPKCMVAGRPMMSCPKKNPRNETEPIKCIEIRELCDDTPDCHNGEDEDPHFCMFKKLEDAEMMRLKSQIRVLAQNSPGKYSEYLDVVVGNVELGPGRKQSLTPVPGKEDTFKLPANGGPLAKAGLHGRLAPPPVEESEEEEEDEDEEEDNEEERIVEARKEEQKQVQKAFQRELQKERQFKKEVEKHRKKRTYRHLLGLDYYLL